MKSGILAVAIVTIGMSLVPTSSAVVINLVNGQPCRMITSELEICFQPQIDMGPVEVNMLSENPIAYLGLVRLIIVDDVVEVPSVGVGTADVCEPYTTLAIECETILAVPLAASLAPSNLGNLWIGGASVNVSGNHVATVPYADILDGNLDETLDNNFDGNLIDFDGDGSPNELEILQGSNPFNPNSTPGNRGAGFPGDWDADGATDEQEFLAGSDPLKACSTPNQPRQMEISGQRIRSVSDCV